jgi:ribulose-phosphate 3-epimerase
MLSIAHPPRLPLIAPSILSADFGRMVEDCRQVIGAGADLLHVDVMDGHFAPNLTMGPDMCRGIRRAMPDVYLDVHLMVTDPVKYLDAFAAAGANMFTFHVEAVKDHEVESLAAKIRSKGMNVGLAINPPTDVERIIPHLGLIDMALVMSVNPGFSGQKFIQETLAKTSKIRAILRSDQRLQMDGGVSPDNAESVRRAGCDVIVGGSAIFGKSSENRASVINQMRG